MSKFANYFSSLSGKNIGIVGAGISNIPLIELLHDVGASITVYDRKSIDTLSHLARYMALYNFRFVSGPDYLSNLNEEIVFRTPSLLPNSPALARAHALGTKITTEMDLFFELCPTRTIGITGSSGKTTTSTLISLILQDTGHNVFLGGNIGKPLLSEIPNMKKDDICVVELSSFQLMDMTHSPNTAVVTNITPNHLDIHNSMTEYVRAKMNIFENQSPSDVLVLNLDCKAVSSFAPLSHGKTITFSKTDSRADFYIEDDVITFQGKQIIPLSEIKLPGVHNAENYMAAAAAVKELASHDNIANVARIFPGVPHRLELVRELNNIKYYNSSKDTTPATSIAALSVFKSGIVSIVGGSNKNTSFIELGDFLAQKAKCVILIGETASEIENAIKNSTHYSKQHTTIIFSENMIDAVKSAHKHANKGDVVVLSPASASFDMFSNFEHRGDVFREAVMGLK